MVIFGSVLIMVLSLTVFGIAPLSASASTRVRGYTNRKTHHYVQPHYRSNRNATKRDNYSTKGNTNPYTGELGTRSIR